MWFGGWGGVRATLVEFVELNIYIFSESSDHVISPRVDVGDNGTRVSFVHRAARGVNMGR